MHIGLLEENAALAEFFTIALQMAGYSVSVHIAAASLLDGMLIAAEMRAPHSYDLLLLDISIDTSDDNALLAQFDCSFPEQQIVVLSSSRSDRLVQARQAHPRLAFLPKPFHLKELSALISSHTRRPAETSTGV